jgi:hypothetical protein
VDIHHFDDSEPAGSATGTPEKLKTHPKLIFVGSAIVARKSLREVAQVTAANAVLESALRAIATGAAGSDVALLVDDCHIDREWLNPRP